MDDLKVADDGQGNVRILLKGQWVKPDKIADGPNGGQAFLHGGKWHTWSPKAPADDAPRQPGETFIRITPDNRDQDGSIKMVQPNTKPVLPTDGPATATPLQQIESYTAEFGRNIWSTITSAKDFVTGEGEFKPVVDPQTGKPFPELGGSGNPLDLSTGQQIILGALFNLELNPKHRAELIKAQVPGTTVKFEGDNVIVERNGKRAILNQRGLSMSDVADVFGVLGMSTIGGKVVAGAKSVLGVAGRGAAVAAGEGVVRDVGSSLGGSDRSLSATRTAIDAGAGAGFGFLFGSIGHGLRRRAVARTLLDKNGLPTKGTRKLLTDAGVDVDSLTPATMSELQNVLRISKNPKEAVRLAQARGLEIPLTRGQVTRDPVKLEKEFNTRSGGTGGGQSGTEKSLARTLETDQPEAFDKAKDLVSTRITGSPSAPGAFSKTQAALDAKVQTERTAIKTAFDKARASNTRFNPKFVTALADRIDRSVAGAFPASETKAIREVTETIRSLAGGPVTSVKIHALEEQRRILTNLSAKGSTTSIREAARRARKAYDAMLLKAGPRAVRSGSPDGIKAYREAIGRRARFARRFEDDPIIKKLVDTDELLEGGKVLRLAPEDAADVLLGKTRLGNQGTIPALRKLKVILKDDPEGWNAIRQEVLAKVMNASAGRLEGNLNRLIKERPTLAKALFTKAEVNEIRALAGTGQDIVYAPPGTQNRSGSGLSLRRFLANSPVGVFTGGQFPFLSRGANAVSARNALRPEDAVLKPMGARVGVPTVAATTTVRR